MTAEQFPQLLAPERMEFAEAEHYIRLLASRCRSCDTVAYPRRTSCPKCCATEMIDVTLGPQAELYSYTVLWLPAGGQDTPAPHLVGQARFDEGPVVQGYVDGDVDSPPRVGARVRLVPRVLSGEQDGEGATTYAFRPESPGE